MLGKHEYLNAVRSIEDGSFGHFQNALDPWELFFEISAQSLFVIAAVF